MDAFSVLLRAAQQQSSKHGQTASGHASVDSRQKKRSKPAVMERAAAAKPHEQHGILESSPLAHPQPPSAAGCGATAATHQACCFNSQQQSPANQQHLAEAQRLAPPCGTASAPLLDASHSNAAAALPVALHAQCSQGSGEPRQRQQCALGPTSSSPPAAPTVPPPAAPQSTAHSSNSQPSSQPRQPPSSAAAATAAGALPPSSTAAASVTCTSSQEQLSAFKNAFARRSTFPARQDFDKLLVYDLEATCNRARTIAPIEIIELSCVIVDVSTQTMEAEYQAYVRPTEHPQLDPFCTELTGIQQHQVDAAAGLAEVLQQHHSWLQQQGVLQPGVCCVAVTWTEWDLKVAMCAECAWRNIQRQPYLCRWIDLKRAYQQKYKRAGNLRTCVTNAGLDWEGRAHSGLDDARNTARLAIKLLQSSVRLRLTDHYEGGPSNTTNSSSTAPTRAPPFAESAGLLPGSSHAGSTLGEQPGTQELAGTNAAAAAAVPAAGGAGSGVGRPLKQSLLVPQQQQRPQQRINVFDSNGRWNGLCYCGVKAHFRTTKRPGANHGRQFYSCGKWAINRQHRQCEFFVWREDVPPGSNVPGPSRQGKPAG